MTRLDCNVEKCAYNADNCCKLREIDVKGTKAKKACDTQCGSFSNKTCDCEVSAELAIQMCTVMRQSVSTMITIAAWPIRLASRKTVHQTSAVQSVQALSVRRRLRDA